MSSDIKKIMNHAKLEVRNENIAKIFKKNTILVKMFP